jgi:hypothetical protein
MQDREMKAFASGFIVAITLVFSTIALLLFVISGQIHPVFRDQILPSGKSVKITSFHLVWGVEHDERTIKNDCLSIEYVSSNPQTAASLREQEALDVFELIRPVSELWGFNHAEVSAFPTIQHKGHYDLFEFKRGLNGRWLYERHPTKVFIND